MNGDSIRNFEFGMLGLSGGCATFCLAGAIYVLPMLSQQRFNEIWKTRMVLQVSALLLSLCQILPLQLWDGVDGAFKLLPASFPRKILCKVFTVTSLGVFQPFTLLLAGFMCSHALRDPFGEAYSWYKPVIYAFLGMLPFAGGQVISAWWSSWLESTLNEFDEIGVLPYSTYTRVPCPAEPPLVDPSLVDPTAPPPLPIRCVSCKYSFLSVALHAILSLLFLALLLTYGRVLVRLCGNAAMRARIRLLTLLLPALQVLQVCAASVTVFMRRPHTWPHEVAKAAALVCVIALVLAVSLLLVIWPLRSASTAISLLAKASLVANDESDSSGHLSAHHGRDSSDCSLLPARNLPTTHTYTSSGDGNHFKLLQAPEITVPSAGNPLHAHQYVNSVQQEAVRAELPLLERASQRGMGAKHGTFGVKDYVYSR